VAPENDVRGGLLSATKLEPGRIGRSDGLVEHVSILIVADDQELAEFASGPLEASGYTVRHARTLAECEDAVRGRRHDLVVLDTSLADSDGLVVLASLKASHPTLPAILLGRGQRRSDLVLALRLGADDFLAVPFDVGEFQARVDAVLRRSRSVEAPPLLRTDPTAPSLQIELGDLMLDDATGRASVRGMALRLTPIEYNLLAALIADPDHLMSRVELIERVWGRTGNVHSRALDVHMGRLRTKLRAVPGRGPSLVSVRVHAFRLVGSESGQDGVASGPSPAP
jgi:DNA-binding response OmpR family regulator